MFWKWHTCLQDMKKTFLARKNLENTSSPCPWSVKRIEYITEMLSIQKTAVLYTSNRVCLSFILIRQ